MRKLRVGQINLARSRLATDHVRRVAVERKLDVLLIQEPYAYEKGIPGFSIKDRVIVGRLTDRGNNMAAFSRFE